MRFLCHVPTTIQVIILLTSAVHDVYEEPDIYAVESSIYVPPPCRSGRVVYGSTVSVCAGRVSAQVMVSSAQATEH